MLVKMADEKEIEGL